MLKNFTVKHNKLYIGSISAEDLIKKYGSPLYVYDAEIIKDRYETLRKYITFPDTDFHYACKQNPNLQIVRFLKKLGANIEVMSPAEVKLALKVGYQPQQIIYTCSFISKDELKFILEKGIVMNLDSLTQIKWFGELNPNGKISLRLNNGIGEGGHKHVITGGPDSKFGIDIAYIGEAKKLAAKYNLQIIGVHQHIGSNILNENIFILAIKKLLETAMLFDNLEFIDFGGGFGIPYKPGDEQLDMEKLGSMITQELEAFVNRYGKKVHIKFEPGRYFIGEAGVLLGTVTDIKKTPYKTFVGIDSGMNQLLRPALYDSYHEIVNASCVEGKEEVVSVVGNICESTDFFARERKIAQCKEGDILAILDAGASGYAMSSNYNGRPRPSEVLVNGKFSKLIRKSH